eukprot:3697752-Prymnesium_polylepis.1
MTSLTRIDLLGNPLVKRGGKSALRAAVNKLERVREAEGWAGPKLVLLLDPPPAAQRRAAALAGWW